MEGSQYQEKAKRIIENVAGKELSIEERRETAIELAACMLNEARRIQTSAEHRSQSQLSKMMDDPVGKAFTTTSIDQCFRTKDSSRVACQLVYLINQFGIPNYLSYMRQMQLMTFKLLGNRLASALVPLAKSALRHETSHVILPGDLRQLKRHIEKRKDEGVRVNLNRLGEAVLGEDEANRRLQVYLDDLARKEVEYISVKVSTLCSQLNLLAWEDTLSILERRLKTLYREAELHTFVRPNGKCVPKFVNLDMEEYSDLHLTVAAFQRALNDPEFHCHSAGIVLQSYLPDSYLIQQELTVWAMQRVAAGGAPIKIRLVKGANLAMEKVDASLHGWPQTPYLTKADVDANFKRMLHYAITPEHLRAVLVGIGTHNLFDIAYALLLRSEKKAENSVEFEMLEGMAENISKVIQDLSGSMLLYCPAALEKEFHNAVAYFVRRLDENTGPDNFLRHLFDLIPQTKEWHLMANQFSLSCHASKAVSMSPRRAQNRFQKLEKPEERKDFANIADTDWSLPQNRKWAESIVKEWKQKELEDVPLVVGGKAEFIETESRVGTSPNNPNKPLYRHALADISHIDRALNCAENAQKKVNVALLDHRDSQLALAAHLLQKHRKDLLGAIMIDGGKMIQDADIEISEAIDFIEYYRRSFKEWMQLEDIQWHPRGVVVVTPPWNFPLSISLGGIVASLVAGNSVIFKPALETVYVGWKLVNLLWDAGISKEELQFLVVEDEPHGAHLLQDERVSCVVLTGATSTAEKMLQLRPGIFLVAETGGKNAMIITKMSDRDLAIKDLVHSAFAHSGQKCSAARTAICDAEVYEDPHFLSALLDAAKSLKVGPSDDLSTKINPLIREPKESLKRGLTTLEEEEEWLLKPKQDEDNPNLWSPGIKLGVKKGSFMHQQELFGPLLGVMKAKNLDEAIAFANDTPYGLTSGIQTLDEREQKQWIAEIEAGNCYVNRGITGAIVQRQPFGGCKASSFGKGAKAGGPNYVMQLMVPEQKLLPTKREMANSKVNMLSLLIESLLKTEDEKNQWSASIGSYAYYWKHEFSKAKDLSKIVGEDNFLKYTPLKKVIFRVQAEDSILDIARVIAAALTCATSLQISGEQEMLKPFYSGEWLKLAEEIEIIEENEVTFCQRLKVNKDARFRFLSRPKNETLKILSDLACNFIVAPPVANGRVELFHYLRETTLSIAYHRYGYLGLRENEVRSPIL